jgi:hypothetical protein
MTTKSAFRLQETLSQESYREQALELWDDSGKEALVHWATMPLFHFFESSDYPWNYPRYLSITSLLDGRSKDIEQPQSNKRES